MTLQFFTKIPVLYHAVKHRILKGTPQDKWELMRDWANFFGFIAGLSILKPDLKKNWRTAFTGFYLLNWFTIMFYTFYYYDGDILKIIEVAGPVGITVPVST